MFRKAVQNRKKEVNTKKKRALSTIIATLLIIMLTFIAVSILWIVIKNIISNQSETLSVQNDFFKENVEIKSIRVNEPFVNLSLIKSGGKVKVNRSVSESEANVVSSDVFSVVDLSGSMTQCMGITSSCCYNTLEGTSYSPSESICYGISTAKGTDCTSICGGNWIDMMTPAKEANKQLVTSLLEASEENKVGLIAYSSAVLDEESLDLTDDGLLLNQTIDSWQPETGTCICCGINEAAARLNVQSNAGKSKKIIVMSDGGDGDSIQCPEQNTGDPLLDASQAACDAVELLQNLVVHSIGAGEMANEEVLTEISACGNGNYYPAINVGDLVDVYHEVVYQNIISYQSISNINYIMIKFSNSTDSYIEKTTNLPDPVVIKNYYFNLTGKLGGEIERIEIYPVSMKKSGGEVIGPLYDFWEAD